MQVSQEFARLVGPTLGGITVGYISIGAGLGLDAVMLCVSAIMLMFLKIPRVDHEPPNSHSILRGFLHDLVGGLLELRKHSWLWITISAFALINIASTGLTAILLPWLITVHLHLPDTSYGLVNSAAGLGAIVVAPFFGRKKAHRRRGYTAYGGIILNAVALLFLALVHSTIELMRLMVLANGVIMIFMLVWESSLQELVPAETYGRVASLDLFGSWTLLPFGNVVSGWLATKIGGVQTMLIEGTFMICVAIGIMMIPSIRKFD
ncbi:MFS transporter [Alicyclobacillus fastidiosus]|uniref:MFS transporter n=1 Tax=Alicyclobacillus fastidiosus TaxID=392011 RepID=A0ABV5AIQ8_9BACL|nr:MFS transporter [Alicyclobacillus fastidiosus]WEH07787.1 MFS transporter [Alicyclobacillus fastidiosus]